MSQLIAAWRTWAEGSSASSLPLFGASVLFWGRLGKMLQFAAGLAVLLDLVNPDRLRSFGRKTNRSIAALISSMRSSAITRMRDPLPEGATSRHYLARLIAGLREDLTSAIGYHFRDPDRRVGTAVLMVTGVGVSVWSLAQNDVANAALGVALSLASIAAVSWAAAKALVLLSLLAIWAAALAIFMPPFLLTVGLINWLGVILDSTRPGHPLRWLAFLLFVAGFHFDLLAS